jgi:hypothetical protein
LAPFGAAALSNSHHKLTEGAEDEALDHPMEEVIDEAIELADHGKVSLHELLHAWGDRVYGPLFIILGLVVLTPIAAVPGVAAVIGLVVASFALQMAAGRHHPWAPRFALGLSVKEASLKTARAKLAPTLAALDALIKERLDWASGRAERRVAAAVVAVLGLAMVPFDFIPFADAPPAVGIVLYGVAITARDGLVMLIAAATTAAIVVFFAAAL